MVAQNPPYGIQADSHSAELFRRAIASLLGGVTTGTPGGCVAPTDLAVTAGSGNSVNVAAGECWVPGSSASHMGAYYGYNDAAVNLGVTPNASNPLYAIVTASVNDQAYTGNPGVATNTWNLLLTQGTAAPSPTVPSTPSNSLLLAKILVPANAASSAAYTITDQRIFVGQPNALRNNPAGHATQGTNQAYTNTTQFITTNMNQDWVRGGMTFGSSLFTVPEAGIYLVRGQIAWPIVPGAGSFRAGIVKNGTGGTGPTVNNEAAVASGQDAYPEIVELMSLASGDTVGLTGYHNCGSSATTYAPYTSLSIALVSI